MINFPVSDWMPDANIPSGPIQDKWSKYKLEAKLINPNNRRKYTVLIVGSGLAGGSAAATLAELGYNVKCFCYQDSPRRAHSIAAQGGINAAKNYQNDGDSVYRLFYDTVKGGDFRAREANVYRLAEVSSNIIDQCVAQGVPFGREYGGLLDNRSFGGAQLKRTFYSRGQTGQQLLLGAYQAMEKEIAKGHIEMFTRHEMMDLVIVDGEAKGIVTRDLVTGEIKSYAGDTVLLCTGGYGNVFFLSTNAMGCNVTAAYKAYKRGAFFANPCFTQIHPTCIPVKGDYQSKLTLMSESLRNSGRIWVPKSRETAEKIRKKEIKPSDVPEEERDYYLERKYPSLGNLAPRDISSRAAKDIPVDASFLEMLDIVNEGLVKEGKEPIHFDHDCREGICGMCSLTINGIPHGPERQVTTCQLHMRKFKDGDTVWIEPFRAKAFPILRDLMVDRSALDRIIAAGGYIDVRTGAAPNANNIAVEKVKAEAAFDAAACIGCGACVASCKNASAMLFTSAKIAHLNLLPQGQPERTKRVLAMMKQMEAEGFGNCTNQYECEAACPKGVSVDNIARLNRDFIRANAKEGLCY